MKRHVRKFRGTLLAGLMLFALGSFCQADGLFMQLPEDGTWARYDLRVEGPRPLRVEEPRTTEGTLTVQSVGKKTVDDVACRWVEVVLAGPKTVTFRALVPEDQLQAGGAPLANAKKMYLDQGKGNGPDEINSTDSPLLGPFAAMLGAPMEGAEELAAETIKSPAGEFECKGVKGTYEVSWGFAGSVTLEVESRFCDKAEAGFGVVDYDMQYNAGGQGGSVRAQLKEIGSGAKSKIADDIADGDGNKAGQSDGGN